MARWLIACMLVMILAACGTAPENVQQPPAVESTPFDALVADVGSAENYQQQQPTPVSQEIITQADAEYLLLTNLYDRLAPSVVFIEVVVSQS
ncbi:MAG: hypothetical protein AAGK74_01115, partial [Chloroflexota bacterium]